MYSDIEKQARQIIEMITAELDQNLIKNRFDEPIARVAREFNCEANSPIGHMAFQNIIADFVQQIYEEALRSPLVLTDPLAEAILLLENHYQSAVCGNGYTAALLDAGSEAQGGIHTVLTGLAESIKDIERRKYIKAVFTWHLHRCNWDLLCEVARLLLEDYREFIPPRLCECVPAQLVDEIPSIMYMHICSDFTLQQVSFRKEEQLMPEIPSDLETL